jgi:transposase
VLGTPVSTGTLAAVLAEGAAGLEGFCQVVRERLAAAEVAHFDETGARVAGRLHWVHSASTGSLSLFTVHPKRGKVAMDTAGVLPEFHGVAVHDGWSPYWRYEVTHALCGAHLLRELDAVTCEPGQGWAAGMAELLADAKTAADRAREAGASQVDEGLRERLMARYQPLLADGHAANPPPRPRRRRRGRGRRSPAANLLGRRDLYRELRNTSAWVKTPLMIKMAGAERRGLSRSVLGEPGGVIPRATRPWPLGRGSLRRPADRQHKTITNSAVIAKWHWLHPQPGLLEE